LNCVCEKLYGGNWDAHYAAFDLHLATFGAKAYATYLENVVTTLSTLGIMTAVIRILL
jgi:hypothetical protein